VYLLSAHWASGQVDDTQAAVWPAWNLVHHGSLFLDNRPDGLPALVWFKPLGGHLVSHRTMGAILASVPMCALLSWTPLTPEQLNALNGAVLTAMTIATVSVLLRRVVDVRLAVAATVALAFGTSLWTTTAAETWPHTLDVLCLALALLAVSGSRWWWAGLALAPAMTSRPHLAAVALVLGVGLAVIHRSLRPLFGIGVPTSLAMGSLLCWNRWMFGSWSIGGAYSGAQQKVTSVPASTDVLTSWLTNAAGAFFSPGVGLMVFSPVALLAVWWLVSGRSAVPSWAWLALAGGLLYQAIQLYLDVFTGGGGFFGNRLVTELLVLATPAVVTSYTQWGRHHPAGQVLAVTACALGIATHFVGAFLGWYLIGGAHDSDWTRYYPLAVVRHAGITGWVLAAIALLSVAIATTQAWQERRPARRVAASSAPRSAESTAQPLKASV
jgi:hypothetical protein